MKKSRRFRMSKTQTRDLIVFEIMMLAAAVLPSRYGYRGHDLVARWLFDNPGFVLTAAVNFVLLNLLVLLILRAARFFTARKKK